MTHSVRNRSRLMLGCGSAALALALVMAPRAAQAQAINGTGTVVQGSAVITDTSPGQTTIDVATATAVIDWTPTEDAGGNALDFLPTGNTATYQSAVTADFAVLNRILPATNGNVAVINGAVISRFQTAVGPAVPGGFVAFYSPTGILIGSTATFDVGRLLLTTLDTSNTDFQNFAEIGLPLTLTGAAGSTARIQINPGAQILATPENSFFAVVAADVQMLGTARINGSHAYVAGEVVNLNFSNGLFNISVPVGTAATGNVMRLDGTIGGPSSNGLGDNHMIYALATAQADPISMIFRGNLGFDPAQSAGIVNGEIILSANYNVFGRVVDGGSISDGINAVFGANSANSTVRADIFMEDFAASSSVLAIGTHRTQVSAVNAASAVAGNLLMVGRENSELTASNGQTFTISGDVLVSAQDYGVVSSTLQSLTDINATGGVAFIDAFGGGTMNIGGSALAAADAFGGADTLNFIAGTAQGGQASIGSTGGTLNITGDATVSARGRGTSAFNIQTGATVRGGLAQFFATQGGQVTLGGNLFVTAAALGAQGAQFTTSGASDAYGGNAFINIFNGGGTITVGGDAFAGATAVGGASNNAGAGSIGDAGQAVANIDGAGLITITGGLQLEADGTGGENAGGTGGVGLGGRASTALFTGGTINVGLDYNADADGLGGNGQTGGAGFGGIAGAIATIGDITFGGSTFASAAGLGGNAFFGFGGNGGLGRGGNAFLQANGTLAQAASLTIAGDAIASAQGVGGDGGQSDGLAIVGGRGGDGYGGQFTVPNQADPAFNSGAFILAGGDNGTLSVGGDTLSLATGFGGRGGSGISNPLLSGAGGNGFGGLAQAGLALLGQTGALGQGSASFGLLEVEANGFGGSGGFSGNDFPSGNGGNGTGGDAFLTVRAGDITANQIELTASGFGADGGLAGNGGGGQAAVFGSLGGTLIANQINILAQGVGGFSGIGTGGNATGGLAAIEGDGISFTINGDATVDASASGGNSEDGAGGNAIGGEAYVATVTPNTPGAISITGHARVLANAVGGNTFTSFVAANGTGGTAYIEALGGSTINMGSAQVHAVGRGGSAQTHQSGNGTGGAARIAASGANSRVTILRNVPISATNTSGGIAIVSSNGIADTTNGGNGIGGTGRGGTSDISATAGGSLALPTNIASDPNAAFGSLSIQSRGFGGGSVVDGGAGGAAFGGTVTILADGGSITMGTATPSTFSEGGSSLDPTRNISGGNVTGGSRIIRVLNGGQLTMEGAGGGAGAQGGNGSGTGNGGNATAGNVVFEVINATANLVGQSILFNQSAGGTGQIGGNVSGGSITLNLNNAQINLLPDAAGSQSLSVVGNMQGGNGVNAGGNAAGTLVTMNIAGSTIQGGLLNVGHVATGGNASDTNGVGGNATGATIDANITGSQLNFVGEALFAADATGGAGGTTGVGGTANSGTVDVDFNSSTIAIAADAQGNPGVLRVRSQAIGGVGATIGNAISARAELNFANATLDIDQIFIDATATAIASSAGQTGGSATSGLAQLGYSGASQLDADLITINSNAATSSGGSARAGTAVLQGATGSTAVINAQSISLLADATGGNPGIEANIAGQFTVSLGGGNVNVGTMLATALGDAIIGNPLPSRLFAQGGNLNVSGTLDASAYGDIRVQTAAGSIIGSQPVAASTTAITITAQGGIEIVDDNGGTVDLGGRSISLSAGRSILLDADLAVGNGNVSVFANVSSALPPPQGPAGPAVITMEQGSSINAGTGSVAVQLFGGGNSPTGAITLADITAASINVRHFGQTQGSDIEVLANHFLTASGTGRAIDLAALGGEVIDRNTFLPFPVGPQSGLRLTGGGHFGIFAATPDGSSVLGASGRQRRYNVPNEQAYDGIDLGVGVNFAAYRIAPVLRVTAADLNRFYGDGNPTLLANISGFLSGDSEFDLDGAPILTTSANEFSNVGNYAIQLSLGSLSSVQGYEIIIDPFTGGLGTLFVDPRPITVTANSLTRIYGDANPVLTYSVGGLGLVNGDQLFGDIETLADITSGVGDFGITQGTLSASSNYALTFVDGTLSITPRALTITADSFSRIYGNANPALTYSVGGLGLVNGDALIGDLETLADAASGVGSFAITQGTLAASANYTLTFVDGLLTVTARPITITANNLTRVYGNANPALTFTVGGAGLVNGDQLGGALATTAGLTTGVGTAAITQGTLSGGANYAISFVDGQLTITPRPITVTANSLTRIYGDANPALSFTVGGSGLVNGDQLGGALATSAGVSTGIGNVAITQGTLAASANYTLTFVGGLLTITARPITVTANNLSRIYGNANPALTFTVGGQGLANGDQLTGALATTANATTGVGTVAITQGSLAASSNYQLTFVGGLLTITPRLLTVTADDLSKFLGQPDPDLTYVVSGDGLVNGDQFTGVLVRDPGEAISTFAIRQGTLSAGSNYAISFVEGTLTIDAPPAPPAINNPSVVDAALRSAVQDPPLTAEEEEERFGMDFPEQPEASLISEDPLLDDPVSSGGDASLYSGTATPEPRGEEK